MDTRDQWYKPNLLYNIHYRPPQKTEPPKMIVETLQFNPSVCTCGEHGCQPQYRMEKRVLWTNKEACNAKQKPKVNEREKKHEYREIKFEERITKKDGQISKHMRLQEESGDKEEMGLKKEKTDQEFSLMVKSDGNKCGAAESFKERVSDVVDIRSGYKDNDKVKENVEGDDDNANNEKEKKEKKKGYDCKDIFGYSDNKGYVCIDEEASNTNNAKENNSNGRVKRYNSEHRYSERIGGEKIIERAFRSDRTGERKCSKEDKIDHTTEVDVAVGSAGVSDDGDNSRENVTLMNDFDEIAESCSLYSLHDGFEDAEVASAFGIMTIYCNSKLHSWKNFDGEDA